MRTSAERYVFYSAEHGTVKSASLRDLLITPSPRGDEEKPTGPHVADLLQNTSNWWVDVFAASTEELRALSKVSTLFQNVIPQWLMQCTDIPDPSPDHRGYSSPRVAGEMRDISELHVYQLPQLQP